ncbi:MAG TPA: hypothetical protein VHU83_23535 [Bryobacteraceae bacterium]|jgi:hypothetical protein|nr:hypothetical protein [Bryobacteraceae bacterium]
MLTRIYSALALGCLIAGTLCAADDPFCGKWKLNQDKSKIAGEQMKIQDLGNHKFKWTFGNDSDTVTADGTDQPVHYGRTMSLTMDGPNSMKMVIKQNGKVLDSMTHALSDDGNMQTIKGDSVKPDGSSSAYSVDMKRVGSGSGWSGTWESTDVKMNSPDEYDIDANGSDGLTFSVPAYQDTLAMKFDGKEYTEKGPAVAPGSTASGKRVDARTLELTDKVKGRIVDHEKFEVSPDGKTLTMTLRETGQPNALTIVYDKM